MYQWACVALLKLWKVTLFCIRRHELGPEFEPVQVEPALDCSDFEADTHELWLLQLPMAVGTPKDHPLQADYDLLHPDSDDMHQAA